GAVGLGMVQSPPLHPASRSRRHRGTIYPLPIGCATSAITITSTVDAGHLRMRNVHKAEQHQHDTSGSALQTNRNWNTSSTLRPQPHHFDQQKNVAEIQRGLVRPANVRLRRDVAFTVR